MKIYRFIKMSAIVFFLICTATVHGSAASEIRDRKKQLKIIEGTINDDAVIPDNPTLDDYIKAGLLRNPGVKASFYKWKAGFKKVYQAFSLPDPQFTYTNYLEDVETRTGPQKKAYSIMQKFPLPDKLTIRKNKAFNASEEAYYRFEKKRLDLVYKITDTYYEYAYLAKAIALTEENMTLLMSFEKVAQSKYSTGIAQNQDLLKVQVELGKLENDLLSLKDLRKPLVARLNALLNFPGDHELPWPDEDMEYKSMEDKYKTHTSELTDELRKNNPELISLSENIEKNRQQVKLLRRDYLPDLSVGVKFIDTDNAMNPSIADSGKDPVMLMFSVNVPIWLWRLNAAVEEAKASLKAAENLQTQKEQELLSRLALVHYKLRDALRQTALYKDVLIPKAVQTLNATQSGYTAGNVDFLSLIDSQRVLLNFQLAYYRHSADTHQRRAELETLLGEVD